MERCEHSETSRKLSLKFSLRQFGIEVYTSRVVERLLKKMGRKQGICFNLSSLAHPTAELYHADFAPPNQFTMTLVSWSAKQSRQKIRTGIPDKAGAASFGDFHVPFRS